MPDEAAPAARAGGAPRRVLFVTGKLAEPALRHTLEAMAPPFAWEVAVLRITVAALMTTPWIAKHLAVPAGTELVVIPGLCEGDVAAVESATGVPVRKGPKDLRELPEFFGGQALRADYGAYDIEIIAEINNAPRLTLDAVLAEAERYRASGADIIDVGCTPGLAFPRLAEVVRELRARGMRVSVDSLDPDEIRTAVGAGAELVLSVNGSNLEVARDAAAGGARVVVIPDSGEGLDSIAPSLERLEAWGAPYLVDPIVEPIGIGFAPSLVRYAEARARWPEAELMMGIGNLTELTEADTTGVNAVLIGICQELGVRTVLTTEVIPWARGAVREVDVARRLMHYAVTRRTIPKRVDDRLVTVKDPKILAYTEPELRELQSRITDPNFRIFADGRTITVLNRDTFVTGTEIQPIFDQLGVEEASHAFYLGKELMKAKLAITLGKSYRQEGSLSWGYLTPDDDPRAEHVRLTQRSDRSRRSAGAQAARSAAARGEEAAGERSNAEPASDVDDTGTA